MSQESSQQIADVILKHLTRCEKFITHTNLFSAVYEIVYRSLRDAADEIGEPLKWTLRQNEEETAFTVSVLIEDNMWRWQITSGYNQVFPKGIYSAGNKGKE